MDKDMKIEMRKSTRDIANAINNHPKPGKYEWITLAISGLSIIISAIAIFVAILIPKQIAEEQNKIALFEKRFEAYQEIKIIDDFLSGYYYIIDNFQSKEMSQEEIEGFQTFQYSSLWRGEIQESQYPKDDDVGTILKQQLQTIDSLSLLFNITIDEMDYCKKFYNNYNAMTQRFVLLPKGDFYMSTKEFDDNYDKFDMSKILEKMEKQMKLYD